MDLSLELNLPLAAAAPFEDYIARYQQLVYRTAWRMLGAIGDAEDACQEVFLKLHSRLGDFEKAPNPSAWLYRVTVNHCLDVLRKRRPQAEGGNFEVLAAGDNPEQEAALEQQKQRLARLLLRLPVGERSALVLRDLEGLSTREVAAILEVSEETVRTAIHRAKEKLRQWMS
ncbi:MAG: sigma-70 family RNA polymerase sigma factor [Bryobacter sp.]|nr:sigma-70 family RNA polymerase sigma factor [Bryobacter sp.]